MLFTADASLIADFWALFCFNLSLLSITNSSFPHRISHPCLSYLSPPATKADRYDRYELIPPTSSNTFCCNMFYLAFSLLAKPGLLPKVERSRRKEGGEVQPIRPCLHAECCLGGEAASVCRRWEALPASQALLLHRKKATAGQLTAVRGKRGAVSPWGRGYCRTRRAKWLLQVICRSSQGKYSSLHRNHCQCPENVSFQSRQFTF